jgi:hypothetical protein
LIKAARQGSISHDARQRIEAARSAAIRPLGEQALLQPGRVEASNDYWVPLNGADIWT